MTAQDEPSILHASGTKFVLKMIMPTMRMMHTVYGNQNLRRAEASSATAHKTQGYKGKCVRTV